MYLLNAATVAALFIGASALMPAAGQGAAPKVDPALLELSQTQPVVRVIVTTRPSASGSHTGPDHLNEAATASAAQTIVAGSLAPAHARSVETLGSEYLVMEVTAEGLRALSASPLVTRITADTLSAPQADGGGPMGLDAPQ